MAYAGSILLTRPAQRGQPLADSLQALGFRVWQQPMLRFNAIAHPASAAESTTVLARAQIVIFISPTAVEFCPWLALPAVHVFAVGQATAAAIRRRYQVDVTVPRDERTEGLLALPALQQVQQRQVVIVRGDDGRDELRVGLAARGAQVEYYEVYQRQIIDYGAQWFGQWQQHQVDCIIATSNAIITAIFQNIDKLNWSYLVGCQWLVVSTRNAEFLAEQYQVPRDNIEISEGASDLAIAAALQQLRMRDERTK